MKKLIFIATLIVILSFSIVSFSHPAKDIGVKFDVTKKNLNITVIHDTKDVNKHFILEVRVLFKNKDIGIKKFKKQSSNTKEETVFNFPKLQKGDKIIVVAKCNVKGIRSKEVTL